MGGGLMRVVRIYINSLVGGEFVSLDPTSIFRSFVDEEIFESSTTRLILDMIDFMHHGNFVLEVDLLCI